MARLRDLVQEMDRDGYSLNEVLAAIRREWFVMELQKYTGNQCLVAARLGIHRNTVNRNLRKYSVDPKIGRGRQTKFMYQKGTEK